MEEIQMETLEILRQQLHLLSEMSDKTESVQEQLEISKQIERIAHVILAGAY